MVRMQKLGVSVMDVFFAFSGPHSGVCDKNDDVGFFIDGKRSPSRFRNRRDGKKVCDQAFPKV